jgi:hypothetical protein
MLTHDGRRQACGIASSLSAWEVLSMLDASGGGTFVDANCFGLRRAFRGNPAVISAEPVIGLDRDRGAIDLAIARLETFAHASPQLIRTIGAFGKYLLNSLSPL